MTTKHTYGAGTRLSSAYTAGRNGQPHAPHYGGPSSAASRAWRDGVRARAREARAVTVVDLVTEFPGRDAIALKAAGWRPRVHGDLRAAERRGEIEYRAGGWYPRATTRLEILFVVGDAIEILTRRRNGSAVTEWDRLPAAAGLDWDEAVEYFGTWYGSSTTGPTIGAVRVEAVTP